MDGYERYPPFAAAEGGSEAAPYSVGGTGFRHVHFPCARSAKGPARGPPRYCESVNRNRTIQMHIMIMAMKATTPPTIPIIRASILLGSDFEGCAGRDFLRIGEVVVVRLFPYGDVVPTLPPVMISGPGVVTVFSVKNSSSVVVVVVLPSQVNSSSGKSAKSFPAKISGAAQRTFDRSE